MCIRDRLNSDKNKERKNIITKPTSNEQQQAYNNTAYMSSYVNQLPVEKSTLIELINRQR